MELAKAEKQIEHMKRIPNPIPNAQIVTIKQQSVGYKTTNGDALDELLGQHIAKTDC